MIARNPDAPATSPSEISAPPHATLWASFAYAIATITLAYPALGGLFLLNPRSDQYKAGYAFRQFAAEHLRSGRGFPQWNPFIEGGLPYIGAMHGDIFYPTFLLRMILPTDFVMTWEFPLHLFLCGLFTYLFLRAWNFGFYGALVGGLAYMLGGSIAGYAGPGHDGKLFVSTMLPLTLLLLTRAMRDDRIAAWGALAITIGLGALSPHPQLLQYLLLTGGVFALYLAFANHSGAGKLAPAVAVKRLAFAAGSVVLGLLISAVQYWPALIEYKPWSPRDAGHDYAAATSFSFPIEETLNAYWPQFSGILDNYWGRNWIHFHSDYFGVIVLLLLGAAFGQTGKVSFRRLWIGIGLGSLLWAFGAYTPLFKIILAVPVFGAKYFRAPSTMIYVTAFSVSVLAAIGMERLLARRVSPKYAFAWSIAALAFAVLMSVGGYAALSDALLGTMSGSLPPQYLNVLQQRAPANAAAAILGVWRSFFFVIAGAAVIWAFLTERIAARATGVALAALLVIDLWSIERFYWVFSQPAAKIYATDPAIDAIKADLAKYGQPARVLTEYRLGGDIANGDPIFFGDALMSHDLKTVGNYHGNQLAMYMQFEEQNEGRLTLTREFWHHENVRYIYTGAPDSTMQQVGAQLSPGNPFIKLAGPVRNAAGSMVFAYKIPFDNPPAWVATAMVKAPPDQAFPTVLDSRFDPARVAIIDTSAAAIQAPALPTLPAAASVHAVVTSATDGAYDISLDQPAVAGQALVISENYFPGWNATADGKTATVARTDFNLIGVALPAGARSIRLRFDDIAYQKGKVVTLIAVAFALVLWGVGLAVDRRRLASAPSTA
ncbi:MAG: hypothetical protein ABJF01_17635 [bacterium]